MKPVSDVATGAACLETVAGADEGGNVFRAKAAAASEESHALARPGVGPVDKGIGRDHVDEAPVRHFEVARFGVDAERPVPVLLDDIDGDIRHVDIAVHHAHQIRTFGAEPNPNYGKHAVVSLANLHRTCGNMTLPLPGATATGERTMASHRLTQRRVDALKPRRSIYELRDTDIKGFGVRVLTSGRKRYFLHNQVDGRREWHAIGDGDAVTLDEAREKARSILAARLACGETPPDLNPEPLFETVAAEVFRRYRRHWKPRTLKVNLGYYKRQILPWFRGRPINGITRLDVRQWFASLHATPVAADRSAPVLSVILRQAEVYGYRVEGSNPCKGIRRYRRQGRERFLSPDEMRRLSRSLDQHEEHHPLQVSVVRLLLFTGCRKSEILSLRWSEYRDGNLYLRDGKAGPRTVWLSSAACRILDDLPRSGPWVFPSRSGAHHLSAECLFGLWSMVRTEAIIEDVRLHDLRHTYASVALAHGETILTIGRLLGHNDPATTLKYTHLSDASVHEAAEALVPVLGGES